MRKIYLHFYIAKIFYLFVCNVHTNHTTIILMSSNYCPTHCTVFCITIKQEHYPLTLPHPLYSVLYDYKTRALPTHCTVFRMTIKREHYPLTLPHARQWCLRQVMVNSPRHNMHMVTLRSGTQRGALWPRTKSLSSKNVWQNKSLWKEFKYKIGWNRT